MAQSQYLLNVFWYGALIHPIYIFQRGIHSSHCLHMPLILYLKPGFNLIYDAGFYLIYSIESTNQYAQPHFVLELINHT